jgi:hypothetical protein
MAKTLKSICKRQISSEIFCQRKARSAVASSEMQYLSAAELRRAINPEIDEAWGEYQLLW